MHEARGPKACGLCEELCQWEQDSNPTDPNGIQRHMSTERGCDLGAPKAGADLTAEDVAGAKGHVRLVQRGHLHQEAITGRGRGLHTSDHQQRQQE